MIIWCVRALQPMEQLNHGIWCTEKEPKSIWGQKLSDSQCSNLADVWLSSSDKMACYHAIPHIYVHIRQQKTTPTTSENFPCFYTNTSHGKKKKQCRLGRCFSGYHAQRQGAGWTANLSENRSKISGNTLIVVVSPIHSLMAILGRFAPVWDIETSKSQNFQSHLFHMFSGSFEPSPRSRWSILPCSPWGLDPRLRTNGEAVGLATSSNGGKDRVVKSTPRLTLMDILRYL